MQAAPVVELKLRWMDEHLGGKDQSCSWPVMRES